jgi:hypothetical protein
VTTIRALLFIAAVGAARTARADCPRVPTEGACRPWSALLLPTAWTAVYAPSDSMLGTWYGGGVELALLAWSDPSHALGPSHGMLRFDIGALASTAADAGTMAMYRGGIELSIERNAARRYLIPYIATDIGGLWTKATTTRGFVDAGAGAYLVHRRTFVIALEATYMFAFRDSNISGLHAQLAVSAALW